MFKRIYRIIILQWLAMICGEKVNLGRRLLDRSKSDNFYKLISLSLN